MTELMKDLEKYIHIDKEGNVACANPCVPIKNKSYMLDKSCGAGELIPEGEKRND